MVNNEQRIRRDLGESMDKTPKIERPPGCYKRVTFLVLGLTATFGAGMALLHFGRDVLAWLGI